MQVKSLNLTRRKHSEIEGGSMPRGRSYNRKSRPNKIATTARRSVFLLVAGSCLAKFFSLVSAHYRVRRECGIGSALQG